MRNLYVQVVSLVGYSHSQQILTLLPRYPIITAIDAKRPTSSVIIVGVVLLHAGLAIAIKILFFAHGSPAAKVPAGDDSS